MRNRTIRKAAPPRRTRNAIIAAAESGKIARRFEPRVVRAFVAAVRRTRDAATLNAIARAIERGDVAAALEATGVSGFADALRGAGLEPGGATFQDELVEAFRAGGAAGMMQFPSRAAFAASLDLTNPEAVRYLTENLPTLIREVSDETVAACRDAVLRGFNEGRPAVKIAREVRGSVGLTRAQARYVGNLRRQLETGELGDATAPWRRRLSATERAEARAVFRAGGERSARVDRIVARYEESLVNRRAKNIARTEVNRASGAGQRELWRQAEERGLIEGAATRRHWLVTPDDRLRDAHRVVPGMNPDGVGLDEPYRTPIGPVRAPRESGDASFDVDCRCTEYLSFEG